MHKSWTSPEHKETSETVLQYSLLKNKDNPPSSPAEDGCPSLRRTLNNSQDAARSMFPKEILIYKITQYPYNSF